MKRFVNFFTCFIFVILFLGMSAGNIFANSFGPIDGVTGSPADSGATCTLCHNSFGLDSGTADFSITAQDNYTLGDAVTVTVSFDNSTTPMHGFELMALDASNTPVGTFSPLGTDTQVSGNYIKQTTTGNGNASWQVQWTAPSTAVTDPVTFYAAGNEADGGGSPSDDFIYTATKLISEPGGGPIPVPGITANGSGSPVTIVQSDTLLIDISLTSIGGDSSLADTGPADVWVYVTLDGFTFYLNSSLNWVPAAPIQPTVQGTLPDFGPFPVLNSTTLGFTLPIGDYVFTFSVDGNMDGVKDDTFTDSVSVSVKELSFKNDILPLFSNTDGAGAWFNYDSGRDEDGANTPYKTACGSCHAGDVNNDGEEACPPECHLMDLNTHAGWLAGADITDPDGAHPILGESFAGATDYDWGHSKLKKRLRNNRMPPGIPFNIDETNRNGADLYLMMLTMTPGYTSADLPGDFKILINDTTNDVGRMKMRQVARRGTPCRWSP